MQYEYPLSSLELILVPIIAILSETLFIYLIFKKSKNINTKRIALFLGILITYIVSGAITGFNYNFKIWTLLTFNILLFLVVKILYKEQINVVDFLLFGYILYLIGFPNSFAAFLRTIHLVNYLTALVISRIIIFSILFFSYKHLNKFYQKISEFWNRRDDGKIKSLTIRNLLLIGVNVTLYIFHVIFLLML